MKLLIVAVIFPNAVIEANAFIGKGCIISVNSSINHDATIADYRLIYSNTVIKPICKINTVSINGSLVKEDG